MKILKSSHHFAKSCCCVFCFAIRQFNCTVFQFTCIESYPWKDVHEWQKERYREKEREREHNIGGSIIGTAKRLWLFSDENGQQSMCLCNVAKRWRATPQLNFYIKPSDVCFVRVQGLIIPNTQIPIAIEHCWCPFVLFSVSIFATAIESVDVFFMERTNRFRNYGTNIQSMPNHSQFQSNTPQCWCQVSFVFLHMTYVIRSIKRLYTIFSNGNVSTALTRANVL